jgi:hypothetical protein
LLGGTAQCLPAGAFGHPTGCFACGGTIASLVDGSDASGWLGIG